MHEFSNLPLSCEMQENLKAIDYTIMTEIQEAGIPPILQGKDVFAQAKTGSGKTAAFGIGMLENLNAERYRIQVIVLCPTRELAVQVTDELRRIARFRHNIKLLTLTGGLPMYKQEASLRHQAHVVVGTPGRVLKLLQRHSLVLDEVKTLVLDEADRMLDMGFIEAITDIIKYAPTKRQTLCFSATFPRGVKSLADRIMDRPVKIKVDSQHDETVIAQHFYEVSQKDKTRAVMEILSEHKLDSALIFCNTKDACRRVRAELNDAGLHALELHGDLEQKDRTETLIRFSNGSSRILVATDVAARGIDIEDLAGVINYDLPFDPDVYLHRIGRTGRAGREGVAFSLMEPGEDFRLDQINENMNTVFSAMHVGFEYRSHHPDLVPAMITLSINGGRKNKISAGDILGALTSKDGIAGNEVGKIDRLDYLTFVAVKRHAGQKALRVLENHPIKGRSFRAMMND